MKRLDHCTTHWKPLQHTATHYMDEKTRPLYNTLQHTATHWNTLQRAATMKRLDYYTTHCNTLQHTATHSNDEKTRPLDIQHTSSYIGPPIPYKGSSRGPKIGTYSDWGLSSVLVINKHQSHKNRVVTMRRLPHMHPIRKKPLLESSHCCNCKTHCNTLQRRID